MNQVRLLLAMTIIGFQSVLFAQQSEKSFHYTELTKTNGAHAQFVENYNKGVKAYNKAVSHIKSKTDDTTVDDLKKIQSEVKNDLTQAKNYFESAYKINSKDKNLLFGLAGCYFGLGDYEKSKQYRQESEKLKD